MFSLLCVYLSQKGLLTIEGTIVMEYQEIWLMEVKDKGWA